ncbi:MAG: serpin family protein [Actinophytocola sp.]|uniref:serpin family protein n=1 Tax=Actinophytocola sp. TaxID=1872138 RepID=UPI003C7086BC
MTITSRTGRRRLAALGLVVVVAACGAEPEAEQPPPPPPSPLPVARQVSTDMAGLVSAIDAFGLDLLNAPALAGKTNLVVSPTSAAIALRMAGAGAAGETLAQMRKVLHLSGGAQPGLPAFDQTDLKVSNTAWVQEGMALKPAYRDTLRDRFDTPLGEADFTADADGARERINQTVADQTSGKITDLFPPGSIDHDSRLVLTNAVHLKAPWAQEFPAEKTVDAPFTRGDGSTVTVPMMHNDPAQEVMLGYAEGPGYQVVTLPYRGGKLAFTVIVPATADALRDKEIAGLLGEVRTAPVTLAMPRFTTRSTLDLTDTLIAAGMPDAFSDGADFSGVTDEAALYLDSVRHNTFVQVDEKGAEAAAATGIDEQAISGWGHMVTVDRPFLFVITDTTTGAPLLLGRIADPTV